jgi:hypothetical protein
MGMLDQMIEKGPSFICMQLSLFGIAAMSGRGNANLCLTSTPQIIAGSEATSWLFEN